MFCRNCGKEIESQAAQCPHCGTKTRVGYIRGKIKKYSFITSGAIVMFILIMVILQATGFFEYINRQKELREIRSTRMEMAENTLESLSFNAVKISYEGLSATLSFDNEQMYILDGAGNIGTFLAYSKGGKVYQCVNEAEVFSETKISPLSRDVFEKMAGLIKDEMEYESHDADSTVLKGTLEDSKEIVQLIREFAKFSGEDVDFDDSMKNLAFTLNIYTDGRIMVTLNDCSIEYMLTDIDAKEEMKAVFVERFRDSVRSGTYYLSDNNTEIRIDEDCEVISDDFERKIMLYINGEAKTVSYDSLKESEKGLYYENTLYPAGTRAEYEQKQEMRREQEEAMKEELAACKKCVIVNKKLKVLIGLREVSDGFFGAKNYGEYYTEPYEKARIVVHKIEGRLEDDSYGIFMSGEFTAGNGKVFPFNKQVDVCRDYVCMESEKGQELFEGYEDHEKIGFSKNRVVLTNWEIGGYY